MNDKDYSELRVRLMAHQVLLCAVLAAHPDKDRLSGFVAEALDQMKSQFLASHLADDVLDIFDKEIHSILKKTQIAAEGN